MLKLLSGNPSVAYCSREKSGAEQIATRQASAEIPHWSTTWA
jgi:hypothetical protein